MAGAWLRRKRIPSIGFSYSGKDFIISMSLYTLSVVLCLILRGASQDGDTGYVYMIFLLDVFLTALLTEGFFFSLIISIFAVLSVDYIFTPPYWNVSFTLSGFPLTFLVTMTISVVTGIVTSRAKQMDEVRREAELERMHGNLLRAVSHDIRTPLTGIVGATNVLLEQENSLTPEQRHELIRNANEEAQWLIRIVENLLSITPHMGGDEAKVNKTPEAAEEIIEGAVRQVYPPVRNGHPGGGICGGVSAGAHGSAADGAGADQSHGKCRAPRQDHPAHHRDPVPQRRLGPVHRGGRRTGHRPGPAGASL